MLLEFIVKMQIMKLIYNSQEPSKLAFSLLHRLYSSWICYGLFYIVKCIEKNLHIFSIGYEFSHDVAYKAHIFGLLYVWPYEWYMAINVIFLIYETTEKMILNQNIYFGCLTSVYKSTISIKYISIGLIVLKFILPSLDIKVMNEMIFESIFVSLYL